MTSYRFALAIALATIAAGCTMSQDPVTSTMNRSDTLLRVDPKALHMTDEERLLQEQAAALDDMTRAIIRASTLRGAGYGAAAGCGLALVSASSAGRCAAGALVGGAVGGVIGHEAGKHKVAKRVQLVSRDDAARALSRASARVGSLNSRVQALIATQDAERDLLKHQLGRGEITKAQYDARLTGMRQTRQALAEALSLSAKRAKEAHRLLATAQTKGQDGLTWHLEAAQELETDAESARSQIQLF